MSLDRIELIKTASHKLLIALVISTAILLVFFGISLSVSDRAFVFPVAIVVGAIGGFVSIQRRLTALTDADLRLLSESNLYPWLSPTAGGLLAAVLYLLFLSGLLAGTLFPSFKADPALSSDASGFLKLLHMQSSDPGDYAKLLFWCFVAGFSEKFVTNIIGNFEKSASAQEPDDA